MQATLETLIGSATRVVAETEGTLPLHREPTGSAKASPSPVTRAKRKVAGTQAGR